MSEQYIKRGIVIEPKIGLSILLAIIIQAGAVFFFAANLRSDVDQHTKDIADIERRVDSINDDIRTILVGIEQVKVRLGIIEEAEI